MYREPATCYRQANDVKLFYTSDLTHPGKYRLGLYNLNENIPI